MKFQMEKKVAEEKEKVKKEVLQMVFISGGMKNLNPCAHKPEYTGKFDTFNFDNAEIKDVLHVILWDS